MVDDAAVIGGDGRDIAVVAVPPVGGGEGVFVPAALAARRAVALPGRVGRTGRFVVSGTLLDDVMASSREVAAVSGLLGAPFASDKS